MPYRNMEPTQNIEYADNHGKIVIDVPTIHAGVDALRFTANYYIAEKGYCNRMSIVDCSMVNDRNDQHILFAISEMVHKNVESVLVYLRFLKTYIENSTYDGTPLPPTLKQFESY